MPPALGEHTEDVLQGLLGISEDELRKLDEKFVTGRK
jgi:crotonobetainyl-CoA:carnitine CoA-transferase CaiB-like acyl-CoA transferase